MRSDRRVDHRLGSRGGQRAALVAAALVAAALPSVAHAFADASQFFEIKALPHAATFGASGEGLYFTGAPRYASLDCSTCHEAGPQRVGLRLNANDQDLFANGYVPGKVYELQVEITNEGQGLNWDKNNFNGWCTDPPAPGDTYTYYQCNNNGFALEIDATTGPLVPTMTYLPYCPTQPNGTNCAMPNSTSDSTMIAPGGDAVFDAKIYSTDPNQPKTIVSNGATSWKFYWTAPPAGTGALTVYVAAVDGNGGAGTAANDQDPYNDDTVSANFFLQESGAPVNRSASAGCSIGRTSVVLAPLWLLAPLLLLAYRRRGGTRV